MRSLGIRARLMAAGLLLLALATGSSSLVAWWFGERLVVEGLEARAMATAESVSRALAFPLAVRDREGIARQVRAFEADPDILLIEVSEVSGNVLVRSEGRGASEAATRSLTEWAASRPVAAASRWTSVAGSGALYQCLHPIPAPGGAIPSASVGSVRLAVSSHRSLEILSALRRTLWLASALVLGLGVWVAHALGGRLAGPLERLTSAAEQVALGRLDAAVPAAGPGEVGRLAEAFGAMTRALQKQSDQLREIAAREIARARTDWDATFNAIQDMIAVFTEDGRLVKANRALDAASERRDLVGTWLRSTLAGATGLWAGADGSGVISRETVVGETHLGLSIFPIREDDGAPAGRVVVLRDVTERVRMRDQLVQSEKMSALGLLISGVAHELNNPLGGVLGFAELALRHEAPPQVRAYLEKIQSESGRMRRIMRNFLTFARAHPPERSSVRLNDLVRAVLDLRAYDHAVSHITVTTRLDPGLPEFAGDPHQIQQVLVNLVINAEQAMKAAAGRGTLAISTRVGASGDVELAVEDDGPGLPQEHLPRLFDPFFTTKPAGEGTGLGLSLVLGIVRDHQGTIHAGNRPEGGAIFRVILPLIDMPPAAESEPTRAGDFSEGRLVLLVDDEPALREVMAENLRAAGYRAIAVGTVDAALEVLRRTRPDLVLSDLRMPGKDGQDLFAALRAHPELKHVPVVFTTGDLGNPSTRRFLDEHECPVLAKPYLSAELLEFVARHLDTRPTAEGGPSQ